MSATVSLQRTDGTSETRAAIIRVRAPSGKLKTLTADTVEISGPFVNATGGVAR